MRRMLLLVDPQCDFINGALPVPGAREAMDALAAYLRAHDGIYAAKVVTCDNHSPGHCSFASRGGAWPPHCVQHSVGAAIWPPLLDALNATAGQALVLTKGSDENVEEYSIFKNAAAAMAIKNLARELGIERIDICGLAGDVCVLETLKDGVAALGAEKFHVLAQFSPSLDGGGALADYWKKARA